jgi:hypothetical protein
VPGLTLQQAIEKKPSIMDDEDNAEREDLQCLEEEA